MKWCPWCFMNRLSLTNEPHQRNLTKVQQHYSMKFLSMFWVRSNIGWGEQSINVPKIHWSRWKDDARYSTRRWWWSESTYWDLDEVKGICQKHDKWKMLTFLGQSVDMSDKPNSYSWRGNELDKRKVARHLIWRNLLGRHTRISMLKRDW